jgi:hypothetical protein
VTAYDATRFAPPAPLAYVTLRNRDSSKTLPNVPMLLDSGADITLIPKSALSQLGLNPDLEATYELAGFDGSISLAAAVQLELLLLGRTFKGQFLVIDQEWGIIGRNIMNSIALLFDGPRLQWEEISKK